MSLGAPENLVLFLLLAAAAGVVALLERWRRRARVLFGGPRAARAAPARDLVEAGLLLCAGVLLVIAAARPQWGQREFSRERQGVDVVIALDVSQSMTATDVAPSRGAVAQEEVARFIEGMRGNRVGLVFFGGSAFLRSPLSTDTQALAQIVRRADREPGLTRPGSDIGAALDQAARVLDASDSPGKAVLLVSDGEDHVGAAAEKAAALAAKGAAIFTAGVGTPEGSTLLEPSGRAGGTRVKMDPQTGLPVVTRLDEGTLRAAAAAGGGRYVRIGGSGRDLATLRGDLLRLQQTPMGSETQAVPVQRFQWFAGAAAALLALSLLAGRHLPALRPVARAGLSPRPALSLVLLAALLLGACARSDAVRDRNLEANRLFEEGRFEEALTLYQALLAERPDLPEIAYNAGNTLHTLGRFQRAIEETRRALPPTTLKVGTATYYALGSHYFALERFEESFEAYRAALLLDPRDADAKHNLEVLLRLLNQPPAPPAGQGLPAPGDQGQDSAPDGEPADAGGAEMPSGAQPQPGDQAGPPSNPQRDLQEALAGIGEEFSYEDAVRILDLVQQLQQQRSSGGSQQPAPWPDY